MNERDPKRPEFLSVTEAEEPLPEDEARRIEADADRILGALDALAAAGSTHAREFERYAARVRFARVRLDDLRGVAEAEGGAFAPARVEIALSILDANIKIAAEHVALVLRRARGPARRRPSREAVNEAVTLVELRRAA